MTTIKLRRGTAAEWATANPVLAEGEPGFETDTGKQKIGDGTTAWNDLPYIGGGGSATATTFDPTGLSNTSATDVQGALDDYDTVLADLDATKLDEATADTIYAPIDPANWAQGNGTYVSVVNGGTNLSTARPAGAVVVYWEFSAGVDVGTGGANVVNAQAGDMVFVAS